MVEVDGFVFTRKRAQPESDAAPAASEQSAAKKPRLPASSPQVAATPQPNHTAATPAAHVRMSSQHILPPPAVAATPSTRSTATPGARETAAPASRAAATPAGATPATRALLQQLPIDAAEPDRLASLCELLCAAQIEDIESLQEDEAAVAAVRAVLTAFAASVRAAAADGRFEASAAGNML